MSADAEELVLELRTVHPVEEPARLEQRLVKNSPIAELGRVHEPGSVVAHEAESPYRSFAREHNIPWLR